MTPDKTDPKLQQLLLLPSGRPITVKLGKRPAKRGVNLGMVAEPISKGGEGWLVYNGRIF